MTKVYIFDVQNAFTFFKAGQFVTTGGWIHKNIVNQGDYEFMVVISGCIYLTIDGIEYAVKKHECILIPPYTRHFGYKGADKNSTHYWMHFFPSGPVSFSQVQESISLKNERNYHKICIPQYFQLNEFEKIVILSKQLLDSANDLYNSLLTSNFAITSIAIELSNQYNKQLSSQKNKVPTKFELITQWIRIHSHEHLTVQTIAEEFQLTPTYLGQLFKKYKGISTIQYINQKKIAQAAELLITTDKTIKEISMELGFSSEKYFMKVFKLTNKLTPTEFRNSFPKTYLNNHSVDPSFPKPKQMMT